MESQLTDEEIERNQDFFEKCAKDHRKLATELISEVQKSLGVKFNTDCPLFTVIPYHHQCKWANKMINDWHYFLHGHNHYRFRNEKTNQYIDIALHCGMEFGLLDPWFFIEYIISTKEYYPLPVEFNNSFYDGCKIINKMIELGKFELIETNYKTKKGIVVTDREKIEVKQYSDDEFWDKLDYYLAEINNS